MTRHITYELLDKAPEPETKTEAVSCPHCGGIGWVVSSTGTKRETCSGCNGQRTLTLSGSELLEYHAREALYRLVHGKNAKPHGDFMERDLVVTVFDGNYGPAGVVLAVNGSPPRALMVLTKEGVLYVLKDWRRCVVVTSNLRMHPVYHTQCRRAIIEYLRTRPELADLTYWWRE